MDILNDIIRDKRAEILGALTQQGFNADNAQHFIKESGNSIMSAFESGNVDMVQGDIEQKANSLIGNIDIAALASKVGISSDKAQIGLATIVPVIMNAIQDKLGDASGIMSLLGNSGAAGDLLASVKKFF